MELKKKIKNFLIFVLIFFLSFLIFVSFLFILSLKDLPRPEKFLEREIIQSTKIYDSTGKILLYEVFGEEKRSFVPLEKIPNHLIWAILVAEDKNFYKHHGVDLKGIVRAVLFDLKIMKFLYGGSTINQQLVRSAFLNPEKTLARKTKEVILAIELDLKYSKNQILEWYLNQIPFGPNIYGVEAACQNYFGKSVSEINLSEAALLASLPKAPSLLFPWGENRELLEKRKNYILDKMVEEKIITKDEAEKAKKEQINILPPQKIKAPHFVMMVKKYLEEKYGEDFLKRKGLKVYTTLNWDLQEIAEKVVKEGAERNKKYGVFNAALVALNPKTGDVLAFVGSKDFFGKKEPENCEEGKNCKFEPYFNVAFSFPGRQPGSSFKPFVYATAFEKGYDDKTVVLDEPTCFGIWGGKEYCPQNYDKKFRGKVTLREALAQSLNVPSVKVLVDFAGIEDSIQKARGMGITTLKGPFGPSIVLGGWEVNLLEMVSAYAVFANDGIKIPYNFILKIEDSEGNVLEERKIKEKRVLKKETAQLINDILSDEEARAPIFGYYSPLYFENQKVSVKTGTTDNYRDAWTIGYTEDIVVGVWAGNNDNTPSKRAPGVLVAAPIFHEFMEKFFSTKF